MVSTNLPRYFASSVIFCFESLKHEIKFSIFREEVDGLFGAGAIFLRFSIIVLPDQET